MTIAGLGLVGGSLARALTRAGCHVTGVDRAPIRRRARAARAIAAAAGSLEAGMVAADIVVLAASPVANLRLLRRLARVAPPTLVVTDVSSVKSRICREARRLRLGSFVGGHPMAGGTARGFAASSPDLFRGRPWILAPAASPEAARVVRALVRAVGARPVTIDPESHDSAMAFLSHAPQVVAWALDAAARGDAVARRHLVVAGPGFRDMTRLATSPRPLWGEILAENRAQVGRALRSILDRISRERRKRVALD